MNPVLFTSNQSLARAENINAVYQGYDGEKDFIQTFPWKYDKRLGSSRYALRVCDEFIGASPGKAVMIGHAISGGKTYGLDQPHPYYNKEYASLLTYVIASSEEMIPIVARQSGVPESRVLPLGVPRTDAYFRPSNRILPDKRTYLYTPTFRNDWETPMPEIDWQYLDSELTDQELFIVKPHMATVSILQQRKFRHIIEISSRAASIPYLLDCDVLITDYSSILLDAHVARKPVVLFEKVSGYVSGRGMYLPYPYGYASRYCTTEKELIAMIRNAEGQGEEDIACLKKTAGGCDGHSTERVVGLIRSML